MASDRTSKVPTPETFYTPGNIGKGGTESAKSVGANQPTRENGVKTPIRNLRGAKRHASNYEPIPSIPVNSNPAGYKR